MREYGRKYSVKAGRHSEPSRALRKLPILASDSARARPPMAQDTSRGHYRAGRTHPMCPVSHLAGGGMGAEGAVASPADPSWLESRGYSRPEAFFAALYPIGVMDKGRTGQPCGSSEFHSRQEEVEIRCQS